ncbi:MAG: S9 family peptidase, partial [Chloroflexota bacterium]|nr:S9 family peptidase [Chloroflexota bacterium]
VGVLDISANTGSSTRWIDVGADTGIYIARMEWAGPDSVVIQRLPRRQNRVDILMASVATGKSRLVLSDYDSAWVDVEDQPLWLLGGKQFLWTSERSGWRQLYLYNRDGSLVRQVTRDGHDVGEVVTVDERRGHVYVVEAAPTPLERQVFRYPLRGNGARTRVTRAAGSHEVTIGPNARYLVDYYSTASMPTVVTLYELPSMRQRRVLADNGEQRAKLSRLAIRPPEFFKVPTPGGDSLNAFRIVPAGFDSTRKYPVLMYVYGGPNSQTVLDDYGGDRYLWHQLLAQKGYVVVSVDNRGTGARGRVFRKVVYRNLGKYETRDQIDAARWLASRPWVDGGRIGIWGWSYGGYMAALLAGEGGDTFQMAIAVAPVTDWRLYDTIYTERYMWIPQENPEGYRESAPQTHVDRVSASVLLVHGTGDDNVHAQNSLQLADRLQAAGKQFELMLYPNRTHSIAGGNTRAHLFGLLTRFVDEHLGAGEGAVGTQRAATQSVP